MAFRVNVMYSVGVWTILVWRNYYLKLCSTLSHVLVIDCVGATTDVDAECFIALVYLKIPSCHDGPQIQYGYMNS